MAYSRYPACTFDIEPSVVLDHGEVFGLQTLLNGNLINIGEFEVAPYAFGDFSPRADYVPSLLPRTDSCANQITSLRKLDKENTVVVDGASKKINVGTFSNLAVRMRRKAIAKTLNLHIARHQLTDIAY
jgi:hypothetical protein